MSKEIVRTIKNLKDFTDALWDEGVSEQTAGLVYRNLKAGTKKMCIGSTMMIFEQPEADKGGVG